MAICYKDKTFCSASGVSCGNTSCHRYFGEKQKKDAAKWWLGFCGKAIPKGAPIAWADFSVDCPYQKDL